MNYSKLKNNSYRRADKMKQKQKKFANTVRLWTKKIKDPHWTFGSPDELRGNFQNKLLDVDIRILDGAYQELWNAFFDFSDGNFLSFHFLPNNKAFFICNNGELKKYLRIIYRKRIPKIFKSWNDAIYFANEIVGLLYHCPNPNS